MTRQFYFCHSPLKTERNVTQSTIKQPIRTILSVTLHCSGVKLKTHNLYLRDYCDSSSDIILFMILFVL